MSSKIKLCINTILKSKEIKKLINENLKLLALSEEQMNTLKHITSNYGVCLEEILK